MMATVTVSNVSLGATKYDMEELYYYCGDILCVEMLSYDETTQMAYVTFKNMQGAETAVSLSEAIVAEMPVTVISAPDYNLQTLTWITYSFAKLGERADKMGKKGEQNRTRDPQKASASASPSDEPNNVGGFSSDEPKNVGFFAALTDFKDASLLKFPDGSEAELRRLNVVNFKQRHPEEYRKFFAKRLKMDAWAKA